MLKKIAFVHWLPRIQFCFRSPSLLSLPFPLSFSSLSPSSSPSPSLPFPLPLPLQQNGVNIPRSIPVFFFSFLLAFQCRKRKLNLLRIKE